uniref:NADP-dependent oxidoreductase domain-containing protein n=1 Tax=Timema tahoe TaxID=61484 RepID=A0A7R9FEB8_9NEOP|nr:unnamed protein product [Timema tahoe]
MLFPAPDETCSEASNGSIELGCAQGVGGGCEYLQATIPLHFLVSVDPVIPRSSGRCVSCKQSRVGYVGNFRPPTICELSSTGHVGVFKPRRCTTCELSPAGHSGTLRVLYSLLAWSSCSCRREEKEEGNHAYLYLQHIPGSVLTFPNPVQSTTHLERYDWLSVFARSSNSGYRHIDTAYNYNNEDAIGRALKRWLSAEDHHREDLFIATKAFWVGLLALPCREELSEDHRRTFTGVIGDNHAADPSRGSVTVVESTL